MQASKEMSKNSPEDDWVQEPHEDHQKVPPGDCTSTTFKGGLFFIL